MIVLVWFGDGVRLVWAWLGDGFGLAWAWFGVGFGLVWAWFGGGSGLVWEWFGDGLGTVWRWFGLMFAMVVDMFGNGSWIRLVFVGFYIFRLALVCVFSFRNLFGSELLLEFVLFHAGFGWAFRLISY